MNKNTNIYEKVLNSITFPIIIIDKEMIILMVNSATEDFFKNSAKIIIGKSINDYIPFASPLVPLFNKCVENNASYKEYKIDLSTPLTGEHKNVDIQVSPVSSVFDNFQIIFLEHHYEKNLVFQNENLKNKLSMSNMSQALAHEVKNPLAGIRGAAQLLEKNINKKDHDLTELICSEVDRIRRLIDNLEVFDDSIPLELKPMNVHTILRHVKDIMINSENIDFKIIENYDPSIPNVLGNEDQLIQVLINVIKNSIEAFKGINNEDKQIVLTTSFENGYLVKENYSDKKVRLPIKISVKDNGSGISESLMPNIFQPFVSSKRSGEGGLGLSIVSKFISDHNGAIEINSDQSGTNCVIRLMAES